MFCPVCGLEERQRNQFCRACGTDLRPVRFALEKPDQITASAVSARDQIGSAVAAKIREIDSARDLKKFAEDVLPEIEKFLESPAEKRLRRLRVGTITSSIGFGVTLMFLLMFSKGADSVFMMGLGLITFFLGLGFILNALLFTVPKKSLSDKSDEAQSQRKLDSAIETETNELVLPPKSENDIFTSVTEETTRSLREKQSIPGRKRN